MCVATVVDMAFIMQIRRGTRVTQSGKRGNGSDNVNVKKKYLFIKYGVCN